MNFRTTGERYSITKKQLQSVNSLLNKGIDDSRRIARILVLRWITGDVFLSSSRDLDHRTASTLIDYLKEEPEDDWRLNDKGSEFLSTLTARATTALGSANPRNRRKSKGVDASTEAGEEEGEQVLDTEGRLEERLAEEREAKETGEEQDTESSVERRFANDAEEGIYTIFGDPAGEDSKTEKIIIELGYDPRRVQKDDRGRLEQSTTEHQADPKPAKERVDEKPRRTNPFGMEAPMPNLREGGGHSGHARVNPNPW